MTNEFLQTCRDGEIEKFCRIFSSLSIEQKKNLIEYDRFAFFHLAAENGHHELVKFILDYVKKTYEDEPREEGVLPVFLSRNGEGFKSSLSNHHIQSAKYILAEEFLFDDCLKIIAENSEFIKTIWKSTLRNCIFLIFAEQCKNSLSFVQQLLKVIPWSEQYLLIENISDIYDIEEIMTVHGLSPFKTACCFGKLDVVRFLWELFSDAHKKKVIEIEFENCFILAAKYGHSDIIKQLIAWAGLEQTEALLAKVDFNAFVYAADAGHINVIKLIWNSLPASAQQAALSASNFAAHRLAVKNKHDHVAEFLQKNAPKNVIRKMIAAVAQGVIPHK